MTPEERAKSTTSQCWPGPHPSQSACVACVTAAIREAVAEERKACRRAICKGCAEGWPVEEDSDGDLLHLLPPDHLDYSLPRWARDTHSDCSAAALHARP